MGEMVGHHSFRINKSVWTTDPLTKAGDTVVLINYGNGLVIEKEKIESITDSIFSLIKKELPKEFQCSLVIDSIIKELEQKLDTKQLNL